MQSKLVSINIYPVISGKIKLYMENNLTGAYVAKVYLENPVVLKIILAEKAFAKLEVL